MTCSQAPLEALPHGPAFRFVSRLDEVCKAECGRATWVLDGDEPFFAGHFPGRPIVPGVLIAEALAQLSGIVCPPSGSDGGGFLAHVDVRFLHAVEPPVEIGLLSRVERNLGDLTLFEVSAEAPGDDGAPRTIARGSLTLAGVRPIAKPADLT